jgi:hypothetical protein
VIYTFFKFPKLPEDMAENIKIVESIEVDDPKKK